MGVYSDYNKVLKEEAELQSLNEAYYGITPDLQVALDKLSKFRQKYMFDKTSIGVNFNNKSEVNTNKYLVEFNRQMEKIFGFTLFSMQVDISSIQNGYTYKCDVRSAKRLTKSDLCKTKNGIAYKKESKVKCYVFISAGMIFNPNITDKGVLGVILHEIGHNFSSFESKSVQLKTDFMRIIKPYVIALLACMGDIRGVATMSDMASNVYDKAMEKIYNSKPYSVVYDTGTIVKNFLLDTFSNVYNTYNTVSILSNPSLSLIAYNIKRVLERTVKDPLGLLFYPAGWKDEKIADSWATMYGCGADTTLALEEMRKAPLGRGRSYQLISNSILTPYFDIVFNIPMDIIYTICDEHPTNMARVSNSLKFVKAELNRQDLDPKLKKDLLQQQKELEDAVDEYTKLKLNPQIVHTVYTKIMYKVFDGDIRQAASNIFDKEGDKYNKKYDDLRADLDPVRVSK